jgi:Rps23 Pro-64 3,4-dihydroxylase Tpa1-like proline 4-hydroxylase
MGEQVMTLSGQERAATESIGGEAARKRGPMPPFLLFRNFLPAPTAAALLDWAIDNEAQFNPTTVGDGDGQRTDPRVRVSVSTRKFGATKRQLRDRVLELAPDLIRELRVNRLEIAEAELELVAHNDGAFYHRHIDTATGPDAAAGSLRFVSAVYYAHRQPKAFSGGALRLHRFATSDDDDFLDIEPEHNLLVAFPSWAPHEVTPISCPSRAFADSRFAVNIWILSHPRDQRMQSAPAAEPTRDTVPLGGD